MPADGRGRAGMPPRRRTWQACGAGIGPRVSHARPEPNYTEISSTSKTSVAWGGITPAAPRAP